jgi:hypothetical protein
MLISVPVQLPAISDHERHPLYEAVRGLDLFAATLSTEGKSGTAPLRDLRRAAWRTVCLVAGLPVLASERERKHRRAKIAEMLNVAAVAFTALADRGAITVEVAGLGRRMVQRSAELAAMYPMHPVEGEGWFDAPAVEPERAGAVPTPSGDSEHEPSSVVDEAQQTGTAPSADAVPTVAAPSATSAPTATATVERAKRRGRRRRRH